MCVVQNVFSIIPLYGISDGPSNKSVASLGASSTSYYSNQTIPVVKDFMVNKKIHTASVVISSGSSFPDNGKFYLPSNLTVVGNTTVFWTNNDSILHTVTSGNPLTRNSPIFDSGLITPKNKFNHTFSQQGKFEYYCTLHPFMTAKITVTKQIRPMITILSPADLSSSLNVSIANGSLFPTLLHNSFRIYLAMLV